MDNKLQILDCTLRDGGYYTNWDFSSELVQNYIIAMDDLPIDYIEIGYRNLPHKNYHGEFFYCPISTIDHLNSLTKIPLAIILNEREIKIDDIQELLLPCIDKVKMVRIAIDPKNFSPAIEMAKKIKEMGFEVAFNVMYLSEWIENIEFLNNVKGIEYYVDYFYLVDSFGSVYPSQLIKAITYLKSITGIKLGFHGHNNLELALANSLAAIESGISIIDSTVMGMGRGAGNLKTELLLPVIFKSKKVDFRKLTLTLEDFIKLNKQYNWGTSFPYILAGVHSIPQKQIMTWIVKGFYSFNSIISSLNNRITNKEKNIFPKLKSSNEYGKCIIIGGGETIKIHYSAILSYLKSQKNLLIIFSSSRYLIEFEKYLENSFICLVGNENDRIKSFKRNFNFKKTKFILPPSPREIGSFLPDGYDSNVFELDKFHFLNNNLSSHCSVSIQTAVSLGFKEIYLIGFDGYSSSSNVYKEMLLFKENDFIFYEAKNNNIKLISLTPTNYNNLTSQSIYSII